MRTKALVSLLLTFVVSIPVLTQQPQPQKPKPTVPSHQQQETEEDQDSVVRISTNLVQLDAVVTKDGKVITDLTPADFVITEDGKPQSITHFSYVSFSQIGNVVGAFDRVVSKEVDTLCARVIGGDLGPFLKCT